MTDSAPSPGTAYAIVEASGQQFWLQPNRYLDLDRLDADVDSTVTIDTVLLVKDANGTSLGRPYVEQALVELKVLAHRRGPKILVYKMRPKRKPAAKTAIARSSPGDGPVHNRGGQTSRLRLPAPCF